MKLALILGLTLSLSAFAAGTGGAGNAGTGGSGSPSGGTIGENSGMGNTIPGSGNATVTNGSGFNGANAPANGESRSQKTMSAPKAAAKTKTDCSKLSGQAAQNCFDADRVKK